MSNQLHLLIGPTAQLASALTKIGVQDGFTVTLSEQDGEVLERGIQANTEVRYLDYDKSVGTVMRSATIAGVQYVWPATEAKPS